MKFGQRGLDAYRSETSKKNNPLPSQKESTPRTNAAMKVMSQESTKATKDLASPGLVKTGPIAPPKSSAGIEKTARLLLMLSKEEASGVLARLNSAEVESIGEEIARINHIPRDEAFAILSNFDQSIKVPQQGGVETATSILHSAFGQEKGDALLNKAVPETKAKPFAFMSDLSLAQNLKVLKDESPSTIAIILSFMSASQVSAYLKVQEKSIQVDLLKRMAKLEKVHPSVITHMESVVQEKVHRIAHQDDIEIDGTAALSSILKYMDSGDKERILGDLSSSHPQLSEEVDEQMHTIDCIFKIERRGLEKLLMTYDDKRLALLMRGKSDAFQNHIFDHLSSQRRLLLEEEILISPRRLKSEIDEETRELLSHIRSLALQGEILIMDEDEEYI